MHDMVFVHDMVFREKYIGGLAKIIYRSMSTIIGVCPPQYRRVVHNIIYRSMSIIYIRGLATNKTNIFVLETIFIHDTSMCEGVGVDSRLGKVHVDIQVGTCIILLECVCGFHCMRT